MKLNVLSYNIHKGFDIWGTQFTLQLIKESIRQSNADIVFLQEVVGHNSIYQQKLKDWPKETQFEYLADTMWPHFSYGKNAVFPERHHGNAILSRYPITFSENVNISTNKFEQRGLLHCQIHLENTNIHLVNVHLNLLEGGRQLQLQRIVKRVHQVIPDHDPLIICGDFNDWRRKASRILGKELGTQEVFESLHKKSAKTFPSRFPLLSLDRIFYRKMKAISGQVLDQKPWPLISDHLPLYSELSFEPGAVK